MKGSILYSPWGVPGTKTGESSTFPAQGSLGFQGDLTDSLTGQVDMLTRSYEPTLGRFSTRDVLFGDPTDPQSLNQYVYGGGSPVTYTDPTGMCANPSYCPQQIGGGTRAGHSRSFVETINEAGAIFEQAQEYVPPTPSVEQPTMPPIATFTSVMFNPRLPLQERVAAARVVYTSYGQPGRDIAYNWLEAQQLASESSTWSQITNHLWSSWWEGPAAPKIVGGVMVGISGGFLVCAALNAACASAGGTVLWGASKATETEAGALETTAHGATRIAGEAATRGGVLNEAEIAVVRGGGTVYTQSNGAIARVLQQADGRFSVVVEGEGGLITTFKNLSQSSLDGLAKNYGWTSP